MLINFDVDNYTETWKPATTDVRRIIEHRVFENDEPANPFWMPIPVSTLFAGHSETETLTNATRNKVIETRVNEMVNYSSRILYEHQAEAREDGFTGASEKAIAACLAAIPHVALPVIFGADVKFAAFGEDTGGSSLVIQSMITDRRVSFIFGELGDTVEVLTTDESMNVVSVALTGGVDEFTKQASWVCSAH